MEYLLTGAEMSACDRRTSDPAVIGLPSLVLMERAALSVADGAEAFLQEHFFEKNRAVGASERCAPGSVQTGPQEGGPVCFRVGEKAQQGGRRPLILAVAGRGNNGADALAAGRILLERGYEVRFCRLPGEIPEDSSFAVQETILRGYGAAVEIFDAGQAPSARALLPGENLAAVPDLILDGLFGTGLSRPLAGEAAACVETINRCRAHLGSYVIAVDIPSGISSDTGEVMGCAVRCDETRTFAFYKRGHFLHPGALYAGDLHLAQIGITARALEGVPDMFTLLRESPADLVRPRDPGGNKGTFGKVLIVAGRRNMCGAALLAARACMAAGAGMVKIFTHEANRVIVQQSLPEALLETFSEENPAQETALKLRASLDWADVAAAGPAMGTDRAGQDLLRTVLEYAASPESRLRGLVLDADALQILAAGEELRGLLAGRPQDLPCILTPHLAEFAALAGCSVQACKEDREALVRALAGRLQCTVVCKDARTLTADPPGRAGSLFLNCRGNSGMATAGSGDVLTGITAALLAARTGAAGLTPGAHPAGGLARGAAAAGDIAAKNAAPGESVSRGHAPGSFPGGAQSPGFAAACTAVCLHAIAGDAAAARLGEESMTAGDLIDSLRRRDFWAQRQNQDVFL